MRHLITHGCSTQVDAVLEACEWVTDYDDDKCERIVDNMINHHVKTLIKNIKR